MRDVAMRKRTAFPLVFSSYTSTGPWEKQAEGKAEGNRGTAEGSAAPCRQEEACRGSHTPLLTSLCQEKLLEGS